MSSFIDRYQRLGRYTFDGLREVARSLLPDDAARRNQLYQDLRRGKQILDDEDHLNQYLLSYGKMHQAKLEAAFQCLPQPEELFDQPIELYDWGCGQGTATLCLFDFLGKESIPLSAIRTIHLIEPSNAATRRAADVIHVLSPRMDVRIIPKEMDRLREKDFSPSDHARLHLFSNILDVDSFDLSRFTLLFQKLFPGENHFVCVGPYYSNNRRVDEFIAAIEPDNVYATYDKSGGQWKNDWTIALRVFEKHFKRVEALKDIQKRITTTHCHAQFHAGYLLDPVAEELTGGASKEETACLYRHLCTFDVQSNKSLTPADTYDPKLAVLTNILSRGLPTKAPITIERTFAREFRLSDAPEADALIQFRSRHRITAEAIHAALHVVDPRFDIAYYNGDRLGSSFEKAFVQRLAQTDQRYLVQVMEPQRPLSTLMDIPNSDFSQDQRVDFALEIPYGEQQHGFIVEVDGTPFHSTLFQRINDERRDRITAAAGYDTYRLKRLEDDTFIADWTENAPMRRYLEQLAENSRKRLIGSWRDTLEVALAPLAIARVERMLLQAIMSGTLDPQQPEWRILVIERDVPCGALAIQHFQESYARLAELSGSADTLPPIALTIVSTKEFECSPLHGEHEVYLTTPDRRYDLCIDIAMLLRDNIDALPIGVQPDTLYILRTSHYQKEERTISTQDAISYPPLVDKDETGNYVNLPERERVLTYFLRELFRKPSFRPGQLPILSRALSYKTTIGLLPTGGGKSLTYQLAALLQPGVTIVVDPLVSLMVDQVRGMRELLIDAADCVHSGMSVTEKAQKLDKLQKGGVQFMLLSPERYMMTNFRESLLTMHERNHLNFAYGVIDEVHCVSEWGHDFRPSYLHLGRNMIRFMPTRSGERLPLIGLTATASFDVLADVERELTAGGNLTIDSETIVRPEDDSRPELTYRIVESLPNWETRHDSENPALLSENAAAQLQGIVAEEKRRTLLALLKQIPHDLDALNRSDSQAAHHIPHWNPALFFKDEPAENYRHAGILFCPHAHGMFGVLDNRNKTVAGLSSFLGARSDTPLAIGTFVGGDKPSGSMRQFNDNHLNLMVATKAFGMGIDKPNVRYTIHLNHPSSIESYVQEAGRGGRDKQHAISYLLYDPTTYIPLTFDKINDLRYMVQSTYGTDPVWLEQYAMRCVLTDDFMRLCKQAGCPTRIAHYMLEYCKEKQFMESIDKEINLWFHNNAFKGLFKERLILLEMTDRILNVKPTLLLQVQNQLIEETGIDDIQLKVDNKIDPSTGRPRNALKLLGGENGNGQYGYLFLDNLHPTYRFSTFDPGVSRVVTETLIHLLTGMGRPSSQALMRPIQGTETMDQGIHQALSKADLDGYVYVTVSWENQIQQDMESFETSLVKEIDRIANIVDPSIGKERWNGVNPLKGTPLQLLKINDFEELLAWIAEHSEDSRWLRYHGHSQLFSELKKLFCQRRDKADTDKAIYRMCCIGLVEDVTIDYLSRTYELKIRKKSDQQYKQNMLEFFSKYYSLDQARRKVDEIDNSKGRNYIDKCLGYLARFVYQSLEKKRYRSIEDMRAACEKYLSLPEGSDRDQDLKEFIHLYFNSKYARSDYQVEGDPYSLSDDTDREGREDFELVSKYIQVLSRDSSGSEVDNAKHLYGATLICLRAHTENAALQLLLCYCLFLLGIGLNDSLRREAINGYLGGFMRLYELTGSDDLWQQVDQFDTWVLHKAKETQACKRIITQARETLRFLIHEEKFNQITNKYLAK